MSFVSYAQNFEDVMLWRALKQFPPGLYIDVGAQDPIVDSVSKSFYDAGWRGVHVEPSAAYAAALRKAFVEDKVIEAVVSNVSGKISFYEIAGGGLSTARADVAAFHKEAVGHVAVERAVEAVTLAQIFDELNSTPIHWLKIDVEGYEREVLEGWGRSGKRPWIVVIESTYPTTELDTSGQWEEIILSKQYELIYTDGLNRFYLHESRSDIRGSFQFPPNVFDEFQLSGTATSITTGLVERYENALEAQRARVNTLDAALKQASIDGERLKAALHDQQVQHRLEQQGFAAELERLRRAEKSVITLERSAERAWAAFDAQQEELAHKKEALASAEALLEVERRDVVDWQRRYDAQEEELAHQREVLASAEALLEAERHAIADWQGRHEAQFQRLVEANAAKHQAADLADVARKEVSILSEQLRKLVSEAHGHAEHIASLRAAMAALSTETEAHRTRWSSFTRTRVGRLLNRFHLLEADIDITSISMPLLTQSVSGDEYSSEIPDQQTSYEGPYPMTDTLPTSVSQLLVVNGAEFIELVYRTILRRSPDKAGFEHYIERLRQGDSKETIIVDVARSVEARALPMNLEGITQLYKRNGLGSSLLGRNRRLERSINRVEFSFGVANARTEVRINKILDRLEAIEAALGSTPSHSAVHEEPEAGSRRFSRRVLRDTLGEVAAGNPAEFMDELRNAVRQSAEASVFANGAR